MYAHLGSWRKQIQDQFGTLRVNKLSRYKRTETKHCSKNYTLLLSNKKEDEEKCGLILIKKISIQKINMLVVSQYIIGKVNVLIPMKFYSNDLMLIFQNYTVVYR